jgi:DNA polymerase III epsilon subunit-like protein
MAGKNGVYLILDTETTGLHPARHGLIELAAAALDEKLAVLETFQADVCPPESCELDPEAMQVNGFTRERINRGISYAEVCKRFREFIIKHFSAEPVAIGQFYPFDYAFLDHVFSAAGYGDGLSAVIKGNDFIDTKALAGSMNLRALLRGQPRSFASTSLSRPGGLKERFGITGHQAHTALGDVLATREVLIKLLELL